MRRLFLFIALLEAAAVPASWGFDAGSDVLAGPYDGTFESVEVVNFLDGASVFYDAGYLGQRTVIGNVEGGHIWGGHEVFDRTGLDLPESPARLVSGGGALGELDFHATMVGHVLAGTGLTDNGDLSLLGAGMAPLATLWSGAIATSFATDEENIGSFDTTKAAFLVPYRDFFEGSSGRRADVINSSWGYDDPAATAEYTMILDALAKENPLVTLVKSAGNSGSAAAPGGPGSGYNGITVGALGGSADPIPYLRPAEYTSAAPGDFYNPATGITVAGVRAAVDIAAPGDDFALAYYGGKSGSLAEIVGEGNPATDLYFTFNQSGTSFASPVVAGGAALLKDVAYGGLYFGGAEEARDTRVIKSVLMASAMPTTDWENGQQIDGEVLTTTQALDFATGAGRLDLESAAVVYASGTTDVPGELGGEIGAAGWDLGVVARGSANDYFFDLSFSDELELTVSLNWFVNTSFDALTETAAAESFADLDLEVWRVSGGLFVTRVAESGTLYNNTEFLRFILPEDGSYGLRVTFDGVRYELGDPLASETYGLAWNVVAVPEPETWGAIPGVFLLAFAVWRRRKPRTA